MRETRKSFSLRTVLVLTVLASLVAPSLFAQAKGWSDVPKSKRNPFQIPVPQSVNLPNGIRIFLIEDHELPLVTLQAMVKTGGRNVPKEKTGLADIFGDVWRTGGTKTKTGDQLDDFLEAKAAKVETWMDDTTAGISLDCLKGDFDAVLAVFDEVLRSPAFAEDKIKIAKNQVNTGIARRNDEPLGIAERESTKLAYGPDSPYAFIPEYATVGSITRDDLLAWHKRYVIPNRVFIGVVGDFDSKAMLASLKKTFGGWAKGPEFKDPEPGYQKQPKAGHYYIEKKDVNQATIHMVHLGTTQKDKNYYALEVMNEIFGGGFSSRVFSNVRSKKGLGYHASGYVGTGLDYPGVFRMALETKSANMTAGIAALLEEMEGMTKRPATADELSRAKDSILNSFIFRFDSRRKVLRRQMIYEFFGYPPDFLSKYEEGIKKVTADDVTRVAKEYMHRDQLAILVVGNEAEFDKPLSSLGPVTTIDITIPQPEGPKKSAATGASLDKGKAVFAKVVAGLGGEAKVQAVKEIRTKASAAIKKPMVMTVKVVAAIRLPDSIRQDIEIPMMGTMTMVATPKFGYQAMGAQGGDLPPAAREEMLKDLKHSPIVIAQALKAGGKVAINHAGNEKVGAAACDVLEISLDGVDTKLWVDADGKILRSFYRATGQEGPVEKQTDYSDHKQVDGMWIAFTELEKENGEEGATVKIEEFKVNPGLDPKLFDKPEKK